MTDKKLSDNEIIKALECCIKVETYGDCEKMACPASRKEGCYFYLRTEDDYENTIYIELIKDALDLINRQKAEIEGLAAERDAMHRDVIAAEEYAWQLKTEKDNLIRSYAACQAEAIKEVANRLNKEAEKVCIDREGDFVEADGEIYDTVADWCKKTSDNLLEEMVGE